MHITPIKHGVVVMAGNEKRFSEGATLVSVTNLDGVIQYCNRDFIDISGYSEKRAVELKS